jgi:hypothetical protein
MRDSESLHPELAKKLPLVGRISQRSTWVFAFFEVPASRVFSSSMLALWVCLIVSCNLEYGFVGIFLDSLGSANYDINTR